MTDLEKKNSKLRNQFYSWLAAATLMLFLSAVSFEMDMRCIAAVPFFLFLLCVAMVGGTAYGFYLVAEEEREEEERMRKLGKIIK